MKFRGKITDIGCIQHFTRKCGGNITVGNSVRLKWTAIYHIHFETRAVDSYRSVPGHSNYQIGETCQHSPDHFIRCIFKTVSERSDLVLVDGQFVGRGKVRGARW